MTALDWRGGWDIPSVLILAAIRDDPRTHWYVWGLTRESIDTARWLLSVRSRRWVAESATHGFPDEHWWFLWRGVMAHRWALAQRCEPPEGFLPSTELALRPRFGISHLYQTDAELLAELTLAAG